MKHDNLTLYVMVCVHGWINSFHIDLRRSPNIYCRGKLIIFKKKMLLNSLWNMKYNYAVTNYSRSVYYIIHHSHLYVSNRN